MVDEVLPAVQLLHLVFALLNIDTVVKTQHATHVFAQTEEVKW